MADLLRESRRPHQPFLCGKRYNSKFHVDARTSFTLQCHVQTTARDFSLSTFTCLRHRVALVLVVKCKAPRTIDMARLRPDAAWFVRNQYSLRRWFCADMMCDRTRGSSTRGEFRRNDSSPLLARHSHGVFFSAQRVPRRLQSNSYFMTWVFKAIITSLQFYILFCTWDRCLLMES